MRCYERTYASLSVAPVALPLAYTVPPALTSEFQAMTLRCALRTPRDTGHASPEALTLQQTFCMRGTADSGACSGPGRSNDIAARVVAAGDGAGARGCPQIPPPPQCPECFRMLMAQCWCLEPTERPRFSQIITILQVRLSPFPLHSPMNRLSSATSLPKGCVCRFNRISLIEVVVLHSRSVAEWL